MPRHETHSTQGPLLAPHEFPQRDDYKPILEQLQQYQTSFEYRVIATGLPVLNLNLFNQKQWPESVQPDAQKDQAAHHIQDTRLCCDKCGAPSVLADVPPPPFGAAYHPDGLQRVKLHVFPETLPSHLQNPKVKAEDILDLILPFFLTGKSQILLQSFSQRHQRCLDEAKNEVQLCFDNDSNPASLHRSINNYLQLDFNHHVLLRGQLVRQGQEYLIPYEDSYTPYTPDQPPSPTSPPRCIRVIVSQCYPSIGYITTKTVVSLGHNYDSKNWIRLLQVLPTSHSLESPLPIARVPKVYFSYYQHQAHKKALLAKSKGDIVLSDGMASSGWTLADQELLVQEGTPHTIPAKQLHTSHDSLSYEQIAWSTPYGIQNEGLDWWRRGVAVHNMMATFINSMDHTTFLRLDQFNQHILNYLPTVNTISNEELYGKYLDEELRVIKEKSTVVAQLVPELKTPGYTSVKDVNHFNPSLLATHGRVDSKLLKKFNGTVQHIGNHIYMGKSFIVDHEYDKIHKEMKKEIEIEMKARQKDQDEMSKSLKKQAERYHKMFAASSPTTTTTPHDLAGFDFNNKDSLLSYLHLAESVTYKLFSPQSTKIVDLDADYSAPYGYSIREISKSSSTSSNSSMSSKGDSKTDALLGGSRENGTSQTVGGLDHQQPTASNGQPAPAAAQYLGSLRNQSTDDIISAHYLDTQSLVIAHHPKLFDARSVKDKSEKPLSIPKLTNKEIELLLFDMTRMVHNAYFLKWFENNNKAPIIYSNTSPSAVQFQVIRCDPEDGYLSSGTTVYYAGSSQPPAGTEKEQTKSNPTYEKKMIKRLGWINQMTLLPISSSIPLQHRYQPLLDCLSNRTGFENIFNAFVRQYYWDQLKAKKITPAAVLQRFRAANGVESSAIAQQLILSNYIHPGLLGSSRRFRKGQTVNISGAWFVIMDTKPSSNGGIVLPTTTVLCQGPWCGDEFLPKYAAMGAMVEDEKKKFGAELQAKKKQYDDQLAAAQSTKFFLQSGLTPNSSMNGTSGNGVVNNTNDTFFRGPVQTEIQRSDIIAQIYSTPMDSTLRSMALEFVQSFKPSDGILTAFYKTLCDYKDTPGSGLQLTDYRDYLQEYISTTQTSLSKELLESMDVYQFSITNPRDDSKRFRVQVNDNGSVNRYIPVGDGMNDNANKKKDAALISIPEGLTKPAPTPSLITPPPLPTDSYEDELHAQFLTCQLCLSEYQEGEYVRIVSCGHRFHQCCVDPWLRSQSLCPNGRCNRLLELAQAQLLVATPKSV